ncbi:MAG: orotate phosphoribosyltransferase [Legionellales bacterium]|jgi:orotate phosphoribosyltransferase
MQPYQQQFIELALSHQVLTFGDFTLKSGRKSPYFFNMGLFNTGASLARLGEFYVRAIQNAGLEFDQVFGPAYKGIPLVSSVAIAFDKLLQKDMPYSFNRKEAKDHGEGGLIVGAQLSGKVLIIDDVMTAGTAVKEAMGLVKQHGASVAGIVVALDRQERGASEFSAVQEIAQQYQIPVVSIINLQNLIDYMQTAKQLDQSLLDRMLAYRESFASK